MIEVKECLAGLVDSPAGRSGRIYPRAIMEREITRVMEKDKVYGTFGHPVDINKTIVKNISHEILRVEILENNQIVCDIRLLDTEWGKVAQKVYARDGRLRLYARGYGELDDNGVVQEGYRLCTFDIGV